MTLTVAANGHLTQETGNVGPGAARKIVVASDGTDDADAALQLAANIADARGASLQIVSVIEDDVTPGEIPAMRPTIPAIAEPDVSREERSARIQRQSLRVLRKRIPHTVHFGDVAAQLAAFARGAEAEYLICGRGRHGMTERLLGEEHLAKLLRETSCPVLAADGSLIDLPRRILIGADFGRGDFDVAIAAIALAAPDARITIANVQTELPFTVPIGLDSVDRFETATRNALHELVEELTMFPNTIETVGLYGHPGRALHMYARQIGADLIAVGIHGSGFVHRLILGSTTTHLLRSAECSVLAVPQRKESRGQKVEP